MDDIRGVPSDYVKTIANKIPVASRILELGCGTGGDARYLKDLGHEIVATDFSSAVIHANSQAFPDINFQVIDTSKALPFQDESFEIVFANLSLHYFDDGTTHEVFREINRVLKPKGLLIFRCKSIHSQSEKKNAEKIAPNIYLQRGHLRHLFSTDYVQELFDTSNFQVIENKYTEGMVYGFETFFVEAIGEKE